MPSQFQNARPKLTFELDDYPMVTKGFPLNNMPSVMESDGATYIQIYDCPHSLAIWDARSCSLLPRQRPCVHEDMVTWLNPYCVVM